MYYPRIIENLITPLKKSGIIFSSVPSKKRFLAKRTLLVLKYWTTRHTHTQKKTLSLQHSNLSQRNTRKRGHTGRIYSGGSSLFSPFFDSAGDIFMLIKRLTGSARRLALFKSPRGCCCCCSLASGSRLQGEEEVRSGAVGCCCCRSKSGRWGFLFFRGVMLK